MWVCDTCGEPVTNGSGYVHVDDSAARAVVAWRVEQEQLERATAGAHGLAVMDLNAWLHGPQDARWEVHHHACDPYPRRDDYWFGVESCRTVRELLDWNAHLAEKLWIIGTDWPRFIQRTWMAADG